MEIGIRGVPGVCFFKETLLSGLMPDQAALHGLLERIRNLNLTLISVTCGGPFNHNPDTE